MTLPPDFRQRGRRRWANVGPRGVNPHTAPIAQTRGILMSALPTGPLAVGAASANTASVEEVMRHCWAARHFALSNHMPAPTSPGQPVVKSSSPVANNAVAAVLHV